MGKSAAEIREDALEVVYKHRISVHEMPDIRDHILAGNRDQARSLLQSEHELSDEETDTLMAYIEPGMKGKHTSLVEIKPSEIQFPTDAECRDEDDPLAIRFRYFGRRGHVLGEVVTTTFRSKGKEVNEVFFVNERIDPGKLDQVWKIVQEEPAEVPKPLPVAAKKRPAGERQRRLEEILAARRALNLKSPLEVYEKLRLEPEDTLAYCRMTIRYSSEFKVSEGEHISHGWKAIPKKFIDDDGSVHPDYKTVEIYPPLPEGMYAASSGSA
jgi:hypothetical protein